MSSIYRNASRRCLCISYLPNTLPPVPDRQRRPHCVLYSMRVRPADRRGVPGTVNTYKNSLTIPKSVARPISKLIVRFRDEQRLYGSVCVFRIYLFACAVPHIYYPDSNPLMCRDRRPGFPHSGCQAGGVEVHKSLHTNVRAWLAMWHASERISPNSDMYC